MFHMDVSRHWVVDEDLVKLVLVVVTVFLLYFFSVQLQLLLAKLAKKFGEKVGTYSVGKEYVLQRYVYQHSTGLVAKLYNFVNKQLVALSLKRYGVSVFGYMLFWGFIAFVITLVVLFVLDFGLMFFIPVFIAIYAIILIMTRVAVSERMEKREAEVMNAVDLIVPEIKSGVKNSIVQYMDNFSPSVRDDFRAFIVNIQDRGYSFEDAMFILADNLGLVFMDFAQKAIYYESAGDKDMADVFTDIVETNRLRRQLRDENNNAFASLKASFIVSALMTGGYFVFLMFTDDFSRHFFLQTTIGKVLLVIMILIVFGVLAYITTIKSKTI